METLQKRIYIDVIVRNYAFLDVTKLSYGQEKCIVDQIFKKYSVNDTATTINSKEILTTCNLFSPYDMFPIKESCMLGVVNSCNSNGFHQLTGRASGFVKPQQTEKYVETCKEPMDCMKMNDQSSNSDKQKCGIILHSMFTGDTGIVSYQGLLTPCNQNDAATNSTSISTSTVSTNLTTSFVEIQQTSDSSNYEYRDESNFTDSQQQQYSQLQASAGAAIVPDVNIDNSTSTTPNTDNINADVDVIMPASSSYISPFKHFILILLIILY